MGYAALKGGFEGKPAFEKVDGSMARVIFFSARKSRWKINDKLNDSTGGFAFAKVKDGGKALPSASLGWQVFDGSGGGYNEDANVQCQPLAGASGSGEGKSDASDGSDSDADS